MKKNTSIGLVAVLLIFGYLFIPKIIKRLSEDQTITSNRSVKPGHTALDFIRLNGEPKKVPDFLMLNQDSLYISNEDYLGKVYVVEFFLAVVLLFVLS
jgi:protein SCO1/2